MKLIRSSLKMQRWALARKRQHLTIGFVPTMGCLHEGHLELVRSARRHADLVVVSIFVNPIQFNQAADLAQYPRDEKRDLQFLRHESVDVVFLPTVAEIYPPGFQTRVNVRDVTRPLCGAMRPGHFEGVTTVVMKLFQIVQPDVACFGLKDFQQFITLTTMVRDLCLPMRIIGVPTVREKDGLAMSSRNLRLSPSERQLALGISCGLRLVRESCKRRRLMARQMRGIFLSCLSRDKKVRLDYVEVLDSSTLKPLARHAPGRTLLAVAVWVGDVRLIDNMVF